MEDGVSNGNSIGSSSLTDPYTIFVFILIFILVIYPVDFLPNKFASITRHIMDRILIKKNNALRDRQRGGYRFFGESFGFYLFFPSTIPEEFVENRSDIVCKEYYAFQSSSETRVIYR